MVCMYICMIFIFDIMVYENCLVCIRSLVSCICIYAYEYVCVHACVYIYIYIYIFARMYVCFKIFSRPCLNSSLLPFAS